MSLGCPVGYHASDAELERLNLLGDGRVRQVHRAGRRRRRARIAVHTDTWTSMGQEAEKDDRKQAFEGYTVTEQMMASAAPNAGFYHCLPGIPRLRGRCRRDRRAASHVIAQAHNRMHAAAARWPS